MSKRDSKILEILTEKKRIDVTTLAQMLNVSNVTARKDLDSLQDKGLVVREHGYALLANPNDVAGRLAYHYEEKRSIAQRAADFVYDGSTIMIENGSCCALLARIIGETKKNVSIITNSAFIAWYVRDLPEVHVTLLGGFCSARLPTDRRPFDAPWSATIFGGVPLYWYRWLVRKKRIY